MHPRPGITILIATWMLTSSTTALPTVPSIIIIIYRSLIGWRCVAPAKPQETPLDHDAFIHWVVVFLCVLHVNMLGSGPLDQGPVCAWGRAWLAWSSSWCWWRCSGGSSLSGPKTLGSQTSSLCLESLSALDPSTWWPAFERRRERELDGGKREMWCILAADEEKLRWLLIEKPGVREKPDTVFNKGIKSGVCVYSSVSQAERC